MRVAQVPRAGHRAVSEVLMPLCRMRSVRWGLSARTPRNGTSIRNVLACWDFRRADIWPPRSARISTSEFTIRSMTADELSCRPDFAVIIYPGYLAIAEQNFAPNADIHVTEQTPPTFLAQAEDDPVHVENAVVYFMALKNAKVPAEMHIYTQGGHGYGLRRTELPVTGWPQLVEAWLHTINILPSPKR